MAKKAELVPTDQNEVGFIKEVAAQVTAWFAGVPAFIKRANDLEARSKEVLSLAKSIKPPKNGEEDEKVQAFIKRIATGKLTVGGHWDGTDVDPGITKIFHRIHRRLTAKRDVAIKYLDDAATLANKLHNDYTREAKRKAAEEAARLQKIEDDRAAKEREKELKKLDREAAKVEKKGDVETATAIREQKEALAAAPVEAAVVDVKPDIVKAAGAHDRTTKKGEILDAAKFIAAVFEGSLGIPRDVLTIDEKKLNQYARDFGPAVVNRWPGVRVVEDTKVV